MTIRVVVHAEGTRELLASRTETRPPPAPGQALLGDLGELGAAHIIVRRVIDYVSDVPEKAIQFDQGFRTTQGKLPRGSDLLHEDRLRKLMTWFPMGPEPPDLAVVFVDCDGEESRYARLRSVVEVLRVPPQRVVTVAVQEFEAWLIADGNAVEAVVGTRVDEPNPEDLEVREAKEMLERVLARDPHAQRSSIARTLSIGEVEGRCASFHRFIGDLTGALADIG